MRKFLGFLALALVLCAMVASCTSNDVFEPVEKNADETGAAITGSIYVGGSSRASDATVDSIRKYGFDLHIYKKYPNASDASVMDTVEFFTTTVEPAQIKTDGTFIVTTDGYETLNWIKDTTLVFVATYIPQNTIGNLSGFDTNMGHVGVRSDSFDGSADVLFSKATGIYSSSTPGTVPSLSFTFSHMTTKVAASVKAPDTNYTYVVEGITLSVLSPYAYFCNSAIGEERTADKGYFSLEDSTWVSNSQVFQSELLLYTPGTTATAATTTLTDFGTSLYVIPFSLPADAAASIVEGDAAAGSITTTGSVSSTDVVCRLNVTYSVYDNDDTTYSSARLSRTTVSADVTGSLGVGKNLKFNVTLPVLPAVAGSVAVSGWDEQTGVTVENLN